MALDICVIGAGYVGLVTSACLAYLGNKVVAVDADNRRIASLQEGQMPFFEPGLLELVTNTQKRDLLEFTTDLVSAVKKPR